MMKSSTEQEYRERMYRVLQHIQQHLDQALALKELAEISKFSAFHFHRIFKGMVGEPVLQYVKRLRLEQAAVQLKLTDRPVLQIALDAGYETHEAFTRAFKTRFRLAPSAYRTQYRTRRDEEATAASGFGPDPLASAFRQDHTPMKVELKRIEPIRVAYVRHVGPYDQVGEAYSKLVMWAMGRSLLGPATQVLGLSYDDPEVTAPEQLRCDACLVVGEAVEPEGEVRIKVVGGGTCAVTMHQGPYEGLNDTYERLLGHWFPRSGYEPGPPPSLELYHNNPQFTPADELRTEVCVPILNPRGIG